MGNLANTADPDEMLHNVSTQFVKVNKIFRQMNTIFLQIII